MKWFCYISRFYETICSSILKFIKYSYTTASFFAIGGILIYMFVLGMYVKTGISLLLDILIVISLAALFLLSIGLFKWLFKNLKKIDTFFGAVFLASISISFLLPGGDMPLFFLFFFIVIGFFIGFALNNGIRKVSSIFSFIIAISIMSISIYYLSISGYDVDISVINKHYINNSDIKLARIEDPSKRGEYTVNKIYYGSGDHKRREEYSSLVKIKTEKVNVSDFFDQKSGFANKMRKIYWGFDSDSYPLNAIVWYPKEKFNAPLVLIVHGNHNMFEPSDKGYEYLGDLLASRGYIVASIDENFLNGFWLGDYNQSEIYTRGWLLLKHLELWRGWSSDSSSLFYNRVDLDNIALVGHSRGGAAVAAASFINKLSRNHTNGNLLNNFNFSIKGIVQIAPNDPYSPQNDVKLPVDEVNLLVIQGAYDQDVSAFYGSRFYNRAIVSEGSNNFKSLIYIYRANHGQFNTEWGRKDMSAPHSWFANLKPILNDKDQQKIAKVYISAFLESSLKNNYSYHNLFKDYRVGIDFLPEDLYTSQYEDDGITFLADYTEDMELTTGSAKGVSINAHNLKVWSENVLTLRNDWSSAQGLSGVFLGWSKIDSTDTNMGEYTLSFDGGLCSMLNRDSLSVFNFLIFNNKGDSLDLSIEFVFGDETKCIYLSDYYILNPPLKTKLTKFNFIYTINNGKEIEMVPQYIEIPFSSLIKGSNISLLDLTSIRFIFGREEEGEVFLSKIGVY